MLMQMLKKNINCNNSELNAKTDNINKNVKIMKDNNYINNKNINKINDDKKI